MCSPTAAGSRSPKVASIATTSVRSRSMDTSFARCAGQVEPAPRPVEPIPYGGTEFTDGHSGQLFRLVLGELHPEPVLDAHGQLGQAQGLQVGPGRTERRVVVDAVDVVVHLNHRVEDELADLIGHVRVLPLGWSNGSQLETAVRSNPDQVGGR